MVRTPGLQRSHGALVDSHDLLMLDLDGVVYVGPAAVPGAPVHITRAQAGGVQVAYVTNNASRTPDQVANHLQSLGVVADAADVVTSAQAAAHVLAQRHSPGSKVFVIGGPALFTALEEESLQPVSQADDDVAAVVSGSHQDLLWSTLTEGAMLVRSGVPWVASNADLTVPLAHGLAPGHGAQVELIRSFANSEPTVAGKPHRALFDETVRRVGGRRPLVVGDRLDTDIAGANATGVESLLVLTGVSGLADIVRAPEALRPTYISMDLGGLFEAHPVPTVVDPDPSGPSGQVYAAGRWLGSVEDGQLRIESTVHDPDDSTARDADWWRLVAVVAWEHLDRTGSPVGTALIDPQASSGSPAPRTPRGTVKP